MSRYSAGVKTTAGSTTLPLISIYAANSASGRLRELGVFDATATAVDLKMVRLTTTGSLGAVATHGRHSQIANSAQCNVYESHTGGGPTLGNELGYRASLGAAIGSGVVFTFVDNGIEMPLGSTDGIGLIVASGGTGQICQAYMVWDE